ncbi:MAG: BatA domain-containing protein [Woeseiaceae bacterium]
MSFLAPLFLLGAFAIALPFWLHRLQTQSSERKAFSSAMLLETAKQQVHVRRKLKFFVLLALRVALLALLAAAFAKPFFTVAPDSVMATAAGTRLIVVDTSASMGREGVFSQAQGEARRAIDAAPGDALIQVLAADNALRIAGELGNDKAAQRAAVAGLSVSELHLNYGEVMSAVERIAATLPQPVSLHFISDYQASAMPVRFSDLVPAGIVDLTPHVVGTGEPFNWSVEFLRDGAESIEVGVTGAGDRERIADMALLVNGAVVETRGLSQIGQQTLRFEPPVYESGENRVEIVINADDDLQIDNRWYHVVSNEPPATIPLITLNAGGLPLTYLSAALESAGDYVVEALVAGDFDARVLSRYAWVVVDDIGLVDPQLEQSLNEFLQGGGNILAFAGERAAAMEVLPLTGHRHSSSSVRTQADEFLSVGQIDVRHPALAQTEGWPSVNVTRSMPVVVQDGDEVLIRLENNEPFLIERRVGVGRLLLLTGNLDNRWSDLPVRPVFVSFIIEAARYLSGVNEIAKTYTAGASLPLSLTGNTSGQVVDPDGNTILSLADTTREQQVNLNRTGFYEVYTPQGQTVIAANIDPLESDLRKLTQDVLDRWQNTTGGEALSVAVATATDETETVELWHWLLLLLAIVAIAESILGNVHLTAQRA